MEDQWADREEVADPFFETGAADPLAVDPSAEDLSVEDPSAALMVDPLVVDPSVATPKMEVSWAEDPWVERQFVAEVSMQGFVEASFQYPYQPPAFLRSRVLRKSTLPPLITPHQVCQNWDAWNGIRYPEFRSPSGGQEMLRMLN